jgi:hypothetical protein
MTFEDWIFSIHLLFAATLVGSVVMSWIVVVSMRTADTPAATLSLHRVARVATGATIAGLLGVITFGIWLAILRIEFHPWDGWVIGAIALWTLATISLLRSFVEYAKPVEKARALITSGQSGSSRELTALNRTSTGLLLRVLASVAIVLIVVDMIWKPGA